MTHPDPVPAPTRPAAPGGAPDLLYREHKEDLRSAVRALLADRLPPGAVIAHIDAGRAHDAGLWRILATDLGLAGLLVPDALGGQGAGAREAAVVLEELGRAVAPVPYLTSAVIATEALLACAGSSSGMRPTGPPSRARAPMPRPRRRPSPPAGPRRPMRRGLVPRRPMLRWPPNCSRCSPRGSGSGCSPYRCPAPPVRHAPPP